MRPPLFSFDSPNPGPRLLVFGGIHGNEVCGPRAIQKVISDLKEKRLSLECGHLTLVPVCNERAFAANRRSIDENLNRVFRPEPTAPNHEANDKARDNTSNKTSYESRVASTLTPLVDEADYFLDLHSMQSKGEAFVFLNRPNPKSEGFCRALGTKWLIKGWPELYERFPEKASHCTQSYADSRRVPNALIECGTHGEPEADAVAYEAILRALEHLKMIKASSAKKNEKLPRELKLRDLYFREHHDDRFEKVWKTFEGIQKGEVIGWRADGTKVESPRDGFIIFPSPISDVGTEWFYVAE